jgi:peroxiredoxin
LKTTLQRRSLMGLVLLAAAAATGAARARVAAQAAAPDFTLRQIDGPNLRLGEQRGRVVMVNFWATWCGPCRLEMPALQARYDGLKDSGFTVLAVNFDDSLEDANLYTDELGLTFPVLMDPDDTVNDLYRVRGYPTTYFIDRDGMIDQQHVGFLSEGQLQDYLAALGLVN